MKNFFFTIIILTLISCNGNNTQNDTYTEKETRSESNADPKTFDKRLIESLYKKLKSDFEIDFKQSHLANLLNNLDISTLKQGEEFEKQMLFEDFKCDCYDKIKISYSKSDDRFILWVYEEFFEEDLDWCPESSYSYSFQIKKHTITDLKLDFMAG